MEMRGARRAGVVVLCGFVTLDTPFVGGIPNAELFRGRRQKPNKQSVTCQNSCLAKCHVVTALARKTGRTKKTVSGGLVNLMDHSKHGTHSNIWKHCLLSHFSTKNSKRFRTISARSRRTSSNSCTSITLSQRVDRLFNPIRGVPLGLEPDGARDKEDRCRARGFVSPL